VLLSIQNEREWERFCAEVLGRPELAKDEHFATNPARVANRPALDGIVLEVVGREGRDRVIERLAAARIAYGRLSNLDDLESHPQNRFVEVRTSAGEARLLAPPPIIVGEEERLGPVPDVGEHDAAVRGEFA
jgi:crotonobetainyl-CoA:carnitine CoA-transferase CaiB-like acyl-CoA transferase